LRQWRLSRRCPRKSSVKSVPLTDFSNKNDYETLREMVNLKPKLGNFFSLDSLQEALPTPKSQKAKAVDFREFARPITAQHIKSGSLLDQKKMETFENFCKRITNLYIREREIEVLSFGALRGMLPSLSSLDLTDNFLQKMENLEAFGNLEVLQVQGNCIQNIEGLEKNRKLRILNLRNNCISKVEGLDSQMNLVELDLAGQRSEEGLTLAPGCFECLVALKSLDLKENTLHNLQELAVIGGLNRKSH